MIEILVKCGHFVHHRDLGNLVNNKTWPVYDFVQKQSILEVNVYYDYLLCVFEGLSQHNWTSSVVYAVLCISRVNVHDLFFLSLCPPSPSRMLQVMEKKD